MFAVLTLVAGLAATALMTWLTVRGGTFRPWLFSTHYRFGFTDLYSRIVQVSNVRRGNNIYVPFGTEAFTYPPAAIALFFPLTFFSIHTSYLAWTWVSILCLAGTYLVAIATLRGHWKLVDAAVATWAAVATVVIFPPMAETLTWGQTSTILLLLITVDVLVIRGPTQGTLVGIATALKLYPGVFIAFWLFRSQRSRQDSQVTRWDSSA
jgi:alpha-1,2-mannosyltransferase